MEESQNNTPEVKTSLTKMLLEDVFEYLDFRVRQIQAANDYDLIYSEAALDMKKALVENAKRFYVATPFIYPHKII